MQPRTAVIEKFLANLKKSEAKELTQGWQEARQLIKERVPVLQNLCENHDMFIVSLGKKKPQNPNFITLKYPFCFRIKSSVLKN